MYIAPLSPAIATAPGAAPGAGVAPGGGKGTFFLSFFICRRVSTFEKALRSYQDPSASAFVWQAATGRAIALSQKHVLPLSSGGCYLGTGKRDTLSRTTCMRDFLS